MTRTFDMTRIIAPVCRVFAFCACLAAAALAPALSDRLGLQGSANPSAGHASVAAMAQGFPVELSEPVAKIADRINSVWGLGENQSPPGMSPAPVRPEDRPDAFFQIAGY